MAKQPAAPGRPLSKADEFYIRGNAEVLGVVQIAADLGLPPAQVKAYLKANPKDDRESYASSLMDRQAQGVVAMTPEAAGLIDDVAKASGGITQAEINRAAAAGDYERAAELVRLRDSGDRDRDAETRARKAGEWHFIRPPGSEPNGKRSRIADGR